MEIGSNFYVLAQEVISSRENKYVDVLTDLLQNSSINFPSDLLVKMFDKRPCQIALSYSVWIKSSNFLNSLSLNLNRHSILIFIGNALPSFIVVVANVLSLKTIKSAKNAQFLTKSNTKNQRKSRLQNDVRALLVILIESFSVIMISWAFPIFLTMWNCRTLYVESVNHCPKIKNHLATFLAVDLFNSSTNCLLYSLSGKLFRQELLSLLEMIFTFGRGKTFRTFPKESIQQRNSRLTPIENKSQRILKKRTITTLFRKPFRFSRSNESSNRSSKSTEPISSPNFTQLHYRINKNHQNAVSLHSSNENVSPENLTSL